MREFVKVEENAKNRTNFDRGQILLDALDIINGDRLDAHGKPEDSFGQIARLWSAYLFDRLELPLDKRDVAILMALLKIARIQTGTAETDSFRDAAGYIGLAADMKG